MAASTTLKLVQEFMVQENRPYAINDIIDKCGKDLTKANIQRSLDTLVDKGILITKTYGKHKIYYNKQTANPEEFKKDTQLAKQKLNQAQHSLKSKETQLSEIHSILRSKGKLRSLESLEEEREQLLDDVRKLNETLRRHKHEEKGTKISSEQIKKIEIKYETVTTAYRKRKRICNDMLEAIMEGYPKTKKSLIEDIGVETDEEVGFSVQMKR